MKDKLFRVYPERLCRTLWASDFKFTRSLGPDRPEYVAYLLVSYHDAHPPLLPSHPSA